MTANLDAETITPRTMSNSINELAAALSLAQAVLEHAKKDRKGQVGQQVTKYADLPSVWDALREPLTKNGLSVIQTMLPTGESARVGIRTMLLHKSGQWISGDLYMTATQPTPQGIGSAITYARRYSISAITGLCPDDDDDGAAASKKPDAKKQAPAATPDATAQAAVVVKMLTECKAGFKDWAEKREWAKVNKVAKDKLSTEHQLQISSAFLDAAPKGKPPKEEKPAEKEAPAPQSNGDGELVDASGAPL